LLASSGTADRKKKRGVTSDDRENSSNKDGRIPPQNAGPIPGGGKLVKEAMLRKKARNKKRFYWKGHPEGKRGKKLEFRSP